MEAYLTKKHREAGYTKKADKDVAQTTLASPVSDIADQNGDHRGHSVGRHCQKLRFHRRIAKPFDDGRDKEGESIERSIAAHVDDHAGVGLPVFQSGPEIGHFEFFVLGTGLVVFFETPEDSPAIIYRQEFGLIREVVNHPERDDAEQHCRKAFENEYPRPAWLSADALHIFDGSCKQAAEGACNSGRAEKDSGADTKFGALVPT